MLIHHLDVPGDVISCRVLRDERGVSRGVGLARLDSYAACENIIKNLSGRQLFPGFVFKHHFAYILSATNDTLPDSRADCLDWIR